MRDLIKIVNEALTEGELNYSSPGELAAFFASLVPEDAHLSGTPIRVSGFGERGMMVDLLTPSGDVFQSYAITFQGISH